MPLYGTDWKQIPFTLIYCEYEATLRNLEVMLLSKTLNTRASIVVPKNTFRSKMRTIGKYEKVLKDQSKVSYFAARSKNIVESFPEANLLHDLVDTTYARDESVSRLFIYAAVLTDIVSEL